MPKIVILTGAGVSADSGLDTFRDEGGVWSKVRLEDVATPEAFARDPEKVHGFYNSRRAALKNVAPNAAHLSLATLEATLGDDVLLITQNVDDLHDRAGSQRLIHMHGELRRIRCGACGVESVWDVDLTIHEACARCGVAALRPAIVWFGEMPLEIPRIFDALAEADLFVSIGTSGQVYPAAGFVEAAREAGAATLELNLEATSPLFDRRILGRAPEIVPAWVAEVLATKSAG